MSDIIDFGELGTGGARGERLEQLARKICEQMGFDTDWTGNGPDGGKDLVIIERHAGMLSSVAIRWVVSCKDFSGSGRAVSIDDLGSVTDTVKSAKADGFFLITTTTLSSPAKRRLQELDSKNGGSIMTKVWDSADLRQFLLRDEYHDLLRQFMPKSYERVKSKPTFEEAVRSFGEVLPPDVIHIILVIAKPCIDLRLSEICGNNSAATEPITRFVLALALGQGSESVAEAALRIDAEVFEVLMRRFRALSPTYADEVLRLVVQGGEEEVAGRAFGVIAQDPEAPLTDLLESALQLSPDMLGRYFRHYVEHYIEEEVMNDPYEYGVGDKLDEVAGYTQIDEVLVEEIEFEEPDDGVVSFSGTISVTVAYSYDGEENDGCEAFPGEFAGSFDATGFSLESASIDVSSHWD